MPEPIIIRCNQTSITFTVCYYGKVYDHHKKIWYVTKRNITVDTYKKI